MALTLAVVMPSHHRPDLLRRVVPAYLLQRPDELIVVLDGPQPASFAYLSSLDDPALRVLPLPANVGPARARAAGARAATAELLFITDDDIVPGPGLVDRHRAFHTGRSKAVLAGYMPLATPSRPRRGQVSTRIFAADYERAMRRWERDPGTVLDGLWGGNVSMERALYLAAEDTRDGERLRYFEDLDLGLRLRALGATGHFDRAAAGVHLHEKSNASFLREARARGAAVRALEERWRFSPPLVHADDEPALVSRLRRLVAAADRLRVPVPVAVIMLRGALAVAGTLRLWRAEDLTARLLRGILETASYVRTKG